MIDRPTKRFCPPPSYRTVLRLVVGLSVLVSIVGCVTGPDRDLALSKIGEPPADFRSRIRHHLGEYQGGYGPEYGVHYDFSDPMKAAYRSQDAKAWHYGYAVTTQLSTPVREGGGIRRRPYIFFFDAASDQMDQVDKGDHIEKLGEKG